MADGREVGARTAPWRGPGPRRNCGTAGGQCRGGYAPVPRYTFGNFSAIATASSTHGQPEVRQHERGVAEVERGAVDARSGGRTRSPCSPPDVPACIATGTPASARARVERVVVGVVEAAVEAVGVQVAADDPRVGEVRAQLAHAAHAVARGRSSASAAKRPGQRPASFSASSQRAATCSKSNGSSVPWRPMSPVGSSTRRDAELVHARRRTRSGSAKLSLGIAPHLHAATPVAAMRAVPHRGRSGVNALQSVSTIGRCRVHRSSRNRFSLGDVSTSVHASSAPGATTSTAMRTPSRSLSRVSTAARERRRTLTGRRSLDDRHDQLVAVAVAHRAHEPVGLDAGDRRARSSPTASGHTLTPRSFTMLSPRPANGAILRSQLPHAHCSRGYRYDRSMMLYRNCGLPVL